MGIMEELFTHGYDNNGLRVDCITPSVQLPPDGTTQFSRSTDPSGHWITIGGHGKEHGDGHHGGTPVFIGRNGKILKGPVSLKGENVKNLNDPATKDARQARAAHAAAQGKSSRDLSDQEAKKLGSQAHVTAHVHAKHHAKASGVATHDVLQNMPMAHKFLTEQHGVRESAKERARQLTGLHAGNLARVENSHRDYSTVPGFDTAARSVALEHPELGLDPDDSGTAPAIWELIREGRVHPPQLHHPEVAQQAAEWVQQAKQSHTDLKSDHDTGEDDSFDFGFGADDNFDTINFSQFNESQHPRIKSGPQGGEFVSQGKGDAVASSKAQELAQLATQRGWSVKVMRLKAVESGVDPLEVRRLAAILVNSGEKRPAGFVAKGPGKTTATERGTVPDEEIEPNRTAVHEALTVAGATLVKVSESGSRYYSLQDGTHVRVADHEPNEATAKWIDEHNVRQIRIDKKTFRSALEQVLETPEG